MPPERTAVPGQRAAAVAAWTVLILTLPLYTSIAPLGPYLVYAIAICALALSAVRRSLLDMYRAPAAPLFVAVFAALAACFALTSQHWTDISSAVNFAPLLLYAPLFLIVSGLAGPDASRNLARLALTGTLLALAGSIVGRVVFDQARGSLPGLDPIRLAQTSVLYGWLSLVGLTRDAGRWRALYVLGPIMALVTVALTGTRGALLPLAPLTLMAIVFLGRSGNWRWVAAGSAGIAAIGGVAILSLGLADRFIGLVTLIRNTAAGNSIMDQSTYVRLVLYRSAIEAFQDSPWLGHGWKRLMTAIGPHLHGREADYVNYPHLHNDILDFAVSAGLVGVLCYLALLAIPVVFAVRSVRDSQYGVRVYGALVLSVSYFCNGLTDLMFGFEYHTTLYVALTAILIGYCRDVPLPLTTSRAPGEDQARARPAP